MTLEPVFHRCCEGFGRRVSDHDGWRMDLLLVLLESKGLVVDVHELARFVVLGVVNAVGRDVAHVSLVQVHAVAVLHELAAGVLGEELELSLYPSPSPPEQRQTRMPSSA